MHFSAENLSHDLFKFYLFLPCTRLPFMNIRDTISLLQLIRFYNLFGGKA